MTPQKAFWFFVAFACVVFAIGGGSRFDIVSTGPLRAIAAVFLAIAVYFQTDASFKRVAAPVTLIVVLGIWMAVQLIPLPPSIWTALPGREPIHDVEALVGLSDVWRPISLSPARTANSLASLVVPLAALMLLSLLDDRRWKNIPWVVIVAGVVSASVGIAQVATPFGSQLFFYEITNDGSAVGLFSNRNHNAFMLTIALMFCAVMGERISFQSKPLSSALLVASAVVIFGGLMMNASRSGLAGLALVGTVFAIRAFRHWNAHGRKFGIGGLRLYLALGAVTLSSAIVVLFAFMGRSPALERLVQHSAADDQRIQTLPWVTQMVGDNMPFGVGFGAFEQAYRMIEPEQLLGPRYLNNAHNDWLQLPIEGGLPATIIGLLLLAMVARRIVALLRERNAEPGMLTNAWLGTFAILIFALASIVDYPLRTPSLMFLAAIAVAMISTPLTGRSRG